MLLISISVPIYLNKIYIITYIDYKIQYIFIILCCYEVPKNNFFHRVGRQSIYKTSESSVSYIYKFGNYVI